MITPEPMRLIDEVDALSAEERAELASYTRDEPSSDAQERMLARLTQTTVAEASGNATPRLRLGRVWWGLAALSALLLGLFLQPETRPHQASVARKPSASITKAPAPPVQPAAEGRASAEPKKVDAPRPQPPAAAAATRKKSVAPNTVLAEKSDPVEELKLLTRARRVLPSQPERSLALTEEHASAYPRGAFAEEREVLAIEAFDQLGRRGQAALRVRAFLRNYPASPQRARLEVWLASFDRETEK
jgi:hypothetical protein